MPETIIIGDRIITYELIRKKVKNINLRIKPDGKIIISANSRVSKNYIEGFIQRKSDWIINVLERCEKLQDMNNAETIFKDGEVIRILGNDYPISIVSSQNNQININNGSIEICTKNPEDIDKVQKQWEKWFDNFMREKLYQIVEAMYPKFKHYQINMPTVKIRAMKTRWGSCSVYADCITLNKALIYAPLSCIEYVVVHELAHFLQANHSSKFYNLVYSVMPDYKQRKKLLESQRIL
jgi:predicted metal-dependent hydrolase